MQKFFGKLVLVYLDIKLYFNAIRVAFCFYSSLMTKHDYKYSHAQRYAQMQAVKDTPVICTFNLSYMRIFKCVGVVVEVNAQVKDF